MKDTKTLIDVRYIMETVPVSFTSKNVPTILNWSGDEKHTLLCKVRELESNPRGRRARPVSAHFCLIF